MSRSRLYESNRRIDTEVAQEKAAALGRAGERLEQCRAAQLVELERAIHRHVRRGALAVAQEEEHRDLAEVRRGLERADDVDAGDAGAWQVGVDEDHADIVVVTNRAQDLEARADRKHVPAGLSQGRFQLRPARRRPVGDQDAGRTRAHVRAGRRPAPRRGGSGNS